MNTIFPVFLGFYYLLMKQNGFFMFFSYIKKVYVCESPSWVLELKIYTHYSIIVIARYFFPAKGIKKYSQHYAQKISCTHVKFFSFKRFIFHSSSPKTCTVQLKEFT